MNTRNFLFFAFLLLSSYAMSAKILKTQATLNSANCDEGYLFGINQNVNTVADEARELSNRLSQEYGKTSFTKAEVDEFLGKQGLSGSECNCYGDNFDVEGAARYVLHALVDDAFKIKIVGGDPSTWSPFPVDPAPEISIDGGDPSTWAPEPEIHVEPIVVGGDESTWSPEPELHLASIIEEGHTEAPVDAIPETIVEQIAEAVEEFQAHEEEVEEEFNEKEEELAEEHHNEEISLEEKHHEEHLSVKTYKKNTLR